MKNRLIYWTLLGIMIIFSMPNLVSAQDSASFAVSCSIPAVPGLNAPPYGKFNERSTTSASLNQDNETQDSAQSDAQGTIQQESKKQILLADGRKLSVMTQTVYSR